MTLDVTTLEQRLAAAKAQVALLEDLLAAARGDTSAVPSAPVVHARAAPGEPEGRAESLSERMAAAPSRQRARRRRKRPEPRKPSQHDLGVLHKLLEQAEQDQERSGYVTLMDYRAAYPAEKGRDVSPLASQVFKWAEHAGLLVRHEDDTERYYHVRYRRGSGWDSGPHRVEVEA